MIFLTLLFGAADTKFVGQLDVTGMVFFGKISEKFLAEADHGEQTATGAVIFEVVFQVSGEFRNAGAEESDLHFGGSGITFFTGILLDDFSLGGFVHFLFLSVLRVSQPSFPDKWDTHHKTVKDFLIYHAKSSFASTFRNFSAKNARSDKNNGARCDRPGGLHAGNRFQSSLSGFASLK